MKKLPIIFICIAITTSCTNYYYIKKVLDKGVLACKGNTCEAYTDYSCYSYHGSSSCAANKHKPLLVYIDNIQLSQFVDTSSFYEGLVVEVPDEYKDVITGKYNYIKTNGDKRILPKVEFLYENEYDDNND